MRRRSRSPEPPSLLRPIGNDELRDLLAPPPRRFPRMERSVVELRRCSICREYAPSTSLAAGVSLCCHAPLTSHIL